MWHTLSSRALANSIRKRKKSSLKTFGLVRFMFEMNSVWNSKLDSAQGLFCFYISLRIKKCQRRTYFVSTTRKISRLHAFYILSSKVTWKPTDWTDLEMVWRSDCSRVPISWFSKSLLSSLYWMAGRGLLSFVVCLEMAEITADCVC